MWPRTASSKPGDAAMIGTVRSDPPDGSITGAVRTGPGLGTSATAPEATTPLSRSRRLSTAHGSAAPERPPDSRERTVTWVARNSSNRPTICSPDVRRDADRRHQRGQTEHGGECGQRCTSRARQYACQCLVDRVAESHPADRSRRPIRLRLPARRGFLIIVDAPSRCPHSSVSRPSMISTRRPARAAT